MAERKEQTDQQVAKQEWLKQFDESLPTFQWFIEKHFQPIALKQLNEARKNENTKHMKLLLNEIWFLLPDDRFNIKENPPGWREFLNLIEV